MRQKERERSLPKIHRLRFGREKEKLRKCFSTGTRKNEERGYLYIGSKTLFKCLLWAMLDLKLFFSFFFQTFTHCLICSNNPPLEIWKEDFRGFHKIRVKPNFFSVYHKLMAESQTMLCKQTINHEISKIKQSKSLYKILSALREPS